MLLDLLTLDDCRALVNAGALVGTLIFAQLIRMDRTLIGLNNDLFRIDRNHNTVFCCGQNLTGVDCRILFHTGGDQRNIRVDKRYCLCLHVGTHQSAVRIVMFQEWNQCRTDTNHLLRGNVHIFDVFRCGGGEFGIMTDRNTFLVKFHIRLHAGIRLRNAEFIFSVRGEVVDFVGNERCDENFVRFNVLDLFEQVFIHAGSGLSDNISVFVAKRFAQFTADQAVVVFVEAVEHSAVWRFNKAIFINFRIVSQTSNQTDVRTFRSFNRADTSVVRMVYVADIKPGTFPAQTARTQCGKCTLVAQFGQRVVLVHELGQLG